MGDVLVPATYIFSLNPYSISVDAHVSPPTPLIFCMRKVKYG